MPARQVSPARKKTDQTFVFPDGQEIELTPQQVAELAAYFLWEYCKACPLRKPPA